MRSDHIPDHDRRLHMARCAKCGERYDMADGHECFDPFEGWDDYDPVEAEREEFSESGEGTNNGG